MATNSRDEAFSVFKRFIRGTASDAEIESAMKRLEFSSIQDLCDRLSLSRTELREINLEAMNLARQLLLYLKGELCQEGLLRWVDGLHAIVTSRSYQAATPPIQGLAATLAVVSLLLGAAPGSRLWRCLERVHGWIEEGRPVPLRRFLPHIFREMGSLHLCALEDPFSFASPTRGQWIDVELCGVSPGNGVTESRRRRRTSMRIIPFSVFTRRFFKEELPPLISRINGARTADANASDKFYYHPENNQAISLKERFPALRNPLVEFSYYVDETGLAELVFEAQTIHRDLLKFAAGLFCLNNGVRRATLDGIRVPVYSTRTEW